MTHDSALKDYERKLLDNVEEYGWQTVSVVDPDHKDPPFSYSVGFSHTVDQPEVIVFGLDTELMHRMISCTLDLCRDGLTLRDWVVLDGLLQNHSCIARVVSPEYIIPDYLNSAIWYHRTQMGQDLQDVMQIVWPGSVNGLYPWDPEYDDSVIQSQPALYRTVLNT